MRKSRLVILVVTCGVPWARSEELPLAAGRPTELGSGLVFVENQGQWSENTRFQSRGGALGARFEADGVFLLLRDEERAQGLGVRLGFEGAAGQPTLEGDAPARETYNFILGGDRGCWASGVTAWSRLVYRDAGTGIDVEFHEGPEASLEYDVIARPGADLASFALRWSGIESMRIDDDGSLLLTTSLGDLRQAPPLTWQQTPAGERIPVDCRYRILDRERCGFDVTLADPSLPLWIDPVIRWAHRLGGSHYETVYALEVDANQDVLVGGVSFWEQDRFPGAWDRYPPGVLFDLSASGAGQDFIGKLHGETGEVQWITFLGGSAYEWGVVDVAIATDGAIFLASGTASPDWPVTNDSTFRSEDADPFDACVAVLSPDGRTLVYSTLLAGTEGEDWALNVAIDGDEVVVSGSTNSHDFPVTVGAHQTTLADDPRARLGRDLFVLKLRPTAGSQLSQQLVYSTLLGGSNLEDSSIHCMEILPNGDVAVALVTFSADFPTTGNALQPRFGGRPVGDVGGDAALAVLRLDATIPPAEQLVYSTYLGGMGYEAGNSLAATPDGALWLLAYTTSAGLPTTQDAFQTESRGGGDGFLLLLDPAPGLSPSEQRRYASYLGGGDTDSPYAMVLGESGALTIVGSTHSPDFPVRGHSLSRIVGNPPGLTYSFVTRLDATLAPEDQLLASTLLGDGATQHELYGLVLLADGRAVVGGLIGPSPRDWPGFPRFVAPPALDTYKGFVFEIDFCDPHAVISSTGSPATGLSLSAADSTTPAGSVISSVTWDFGDGSQAEGTNVEHSFGPGRHRVTVTVTNDSGCSNSATRLLDPVPCPTADIAPWIAADVGADQPFFPSTARLAGTGDGTALTVCAGGKSLAARADEFSLVYREHEGDGDLLARLDEVSRGETNARTGITMRESLDPGARHVSLVVVKRIVAGVEEFSYRVIFRSTDGGSTSTRSAPPDVAPVLPDAWLRLERRGDAIVATVGRAGNVDGLRELVDSIADGLPVA